MNTHFALRSIVVINAWKNLKTQRSEMDLLARALGGKHRGGTRCSTSILEFTSVAEAKVALDSVKKAGRYEVETMVDRWAANRQFTYNQMLKSGSIKEANAWIAKTRNPICDHLLVLKTKGQAEDTSDHTHVLITAGEHAGRVLIFVGNPKQTFRIKAYFEDQANRYVQLYQDHTGWWAYGHTVAGSTELVRGQVSAQAAFSAGAAKFF